MTDNLPQKPELFDWLENALRLPFRIPRLPFTQTAKNLDKAVAGLVAAGGDNLAARIGASTARIEARSNAEGVLIQYGAKQIEHADPAFLERAREYAVGDILRVQANREQVLRHASDDLAKDTPKTEARAEIDDDWLNAFAKHAEQKSREDVQRMWGRILAAEIRAPGATSLRTLQFLSTVSATEAAMIASAFKYVVHGFMIPKWVDEQKIIPYVELMQLQELNVVSGLYGVGGHTVTIKGNTVPLGQAITLPYRDHAAFFEGPPEGDYTLSSDSLALTEIGKQLYAISDSVVPDLSFFERFCLAIKPANTRRITLVGAPLGSPRVIFNSAANVETN